MRQWSTVEAARDWFVRGQDLAITVSDDLHGILSALNRKHLRRLLKCAERSTTKVLSCDEESRR